MKTRLAEDGQAVAPAVVSGLNGVYFVGCIAVARRKASSRDCW